MSIWSVVRGALAEVNPFDHGQTYATFNPPQKKQDQNNPNPNPQQPAPSQPNNNIPLTNNPSVVGKLDIGFTPTTSVPTQHNQDNSGGFAGAQDTGATGPQNNNGMNLSDNRPYGFWQQAGDTLGALTTGIAEVPAGIARAATGAVEGLDQLPALAVKGANALSNNIGAAISGENNRNAGHWGVTRDLTNWTNDVNSHTLDPLNRGIDDAAQGIADYNPIGDQSVNQRAGRVGYEGTQIGTNIIGAATGIGDLADYANATKLGDVPVLGKVLSTVGKQLSPASAATDAAQANNAGNFISRFAKPIYNVTNYAMTSPIKGAVSFVKSIPGIGAGSAANALEDAAQGTQIPVTNETPGTTPIPVNTPQSPLIQDVSGIDNPGAQPPGTVTVPTKPTPTPPSLIKEVGGDASHATTAEQAAQNARQNAIDQFQQQVAASGKPDQAIEGIVAPNPVTTVTTAELNAERDALDKALAAKEITPDQHAAANDALNQASPVDAKGPIPNSTPIPVKQVSSIPVQNIEELPAKLPENPGKVKVSTQTAPTKAETKAVAQAVARGEEPAPAAATPAPVATPPSPNLPDALPTEHPATPPPLPTVEAPRGNSRLRGLLQSIKEAGGNPAAALRDGNPAKVAKTLGQTYRQLPNDQSFETADQYINDHGVDSAHALVTDPNVPVSAPKNAVGVQLANKYAAEGNTDKLRDVMNAMDEQNRQAGQGIQMLSNWSNLSPVAVFRLAAKAAEDHGVTLPDDFQKQILQEMERVRHLPDGSPERAAAMEGVMKDIAEQLPMTKSELFNNYRYQNMLSSPLSAEKIGTNGILNTLITHPVDLFANATVQAIGKGLHVLSNTPYERTVAYSDVPVYLKNVVMGLPDAWQAAANAFTTGSMNKTFQEGAQGRSTIEQLRPQLRNAQYGSPIQKVMHPFKGSLFSSTHGAIYHYFQSLIQGGEKARLMAHGLGEDEATKQAAQLGDQLTLRSKLGEGQMSPAVKAVDAIGGLVSDISSKDNALGRTMGWVAPFMRVSTNWAKLAVEHSPLGLLDNPAHMTSAQVAKGFTGSVVTGLGLTAAMQDRVTLGPPSDKQAQAAWYASGRKPYSVQIDGHWVPMQYFGPFAITFALPQAVKEASSGTNASSDALTKVAKSVQNISADIVNSTPLPSVAGFFSFLNGDTHANIPKIMADLAGQAIPLDALQRYITDVTDPIYRETKTFAQRIESGIPGMSEKLPAYATPTGQPETRNLSNDVAPYAIGNDNQQFGAALNARNTTLASDAAIKNAGQNGNNVAGGQQVADSIWKLPDGSYAYEVNNQFKKASSQFAAQQELDKVAFAASGKDSGVANGMVYQKGNDGKVIAMQQKDYDYKNANDAMTSAKNSGDVTGFANGGQTLLDNIGWQLNHANLTQSQRDQLTQKAVQTQEDLAKTAQYGGFNKPKNVPDYKTPQITGAKDGYVKAIQEAGAKYGVDINALLSVAAQEGLGGGVGDNGTSFGPFQMHQGGALPPGKDQAWAESPAGIDYAVQQIAKVAGGKRGSDAINAIVTGFEKSANQPGEIANALALYSGGSAVLSPNGGISSLTPADNGTGKGKGVADFGKLNANADSPFAPKLREYKTAEIGGTNIPVIKREMPNIVHRISGSKGSMAG